jgi:predicted transglutaminase-like cysteine proteinase
VEQTYDTLQTINDSINALPYESVGSDSSADNWIDAPVPGQVWECRDYTLAKLRALAQAGWPPQSMMVVLCYTEPFGNPQARVYHAVAGARDADGQLWILDNRWPTAYKWQEAPQAYLWAQQQVPQSLDFTDVRASQVLI